VLLPPGGPDPTQDAPPRGTASTSSAAATAGAAAGSAKVAALIERLKQDAAAAAAAAAAAGAHTRPVKSVVFSQFTRWVFRLSVLCVWPSLAECLQTMN